MERAFPLLFRFQGNQAKEHHDKYPPAHPLSGLDLTGLSKNLRLSQFESRLNSGMTSQQLLERITVEPGKCGGRPCIRGYRMRVTDVLELLANGATADEILTDYPFLESEDIQACLQYAAVQADHAILAAAS